MRGVQCLSLIVLFAGAQSGCARAHPSMDEQSAASPKPAQAETLEPPETDLTGNWTTGTGPAPETAIVTLHPSCTVHPAVWIIKQTGNSIEAWAFPERYDQGIAVRGPGVARIVGSPGVISGLEVTIDDEEYRYRLRYDRESGQLRGTRNGSPFWAARLRVVRTEACPGVP
jgi:hypothetical protein